MAPTRNWCGNGGVGGAELARPRVEYRARRRPLVGLVGLWKHSCPVALVKAGKVA
jgi:hypothetical protein